MIQFLKVICLIIWNTFDDTFDDIIITAIAIIITIAITIYSIYNLIYTILTSHLYSSYSRMFPFAFSCIFVITFPSRLT